MMDPKDFKCCATCRKLVPPGECIEGKSQCDLEKDWEPLDEKGTDEPVKESLEVKPFSVHARLRSSVFGQFAEFLAMEMKQFGAANFLAVSLCDGKDMYEITCQKIFGLTPAQKGAALQAALKEIWHAYEGNPNIAAKDLHDIAAKALDAVVMGLDRTATEAAWASDDEVICPKCCHQFPAVPVNVQKRMARLEETNAADLERLGEAVAMGSSQAEQFDAILIAKDRKIAELDEIIKRCIEYFEARNLGGNADLLIATLKNARQG